MSSPPTAWRSARGPFPRPTWVAFVAAALAACATAQSAGPTPAEDRPEATRTESLRSTTVGGAGLVEFHPATNRARVIDFRGSTESLWPRVINAYDRIGLPLGEVNPGQHSVGTSTVRAVGRLGDARVADYVDCGAGPLGSRLADTYIVYLRAVTELKPQQGADSALAPGVPGRISTPVTTVRTLVTATAKPNSTQGDAVDCVSTGRLETRLVRLIDPAAKPAAGRSD